RVGGGIVQRGHFVDAPADHLPVQHDEGGEGAAAAAADVFAGHVDRLFQQVSVVHCHSPFPWQAGLLVILSNVGKLVNFCCRVRSPRVQNGENGWTSPFIGRI